MKALLFARALVLLLILILSAFLPAHAVTVPSDGLVGYWAGDGNANDSSTIGNNGTFSGPYVSGAVGDAFDVSYSNYFSAPDNPAYSFTETFSVAFWFRGSLPGTFLGQDNGGGWVPKWFVDFGYQDPEAFEFHLNGSGNVMIRSLKQWGITDAWHHLAVVIDHDTYSFYLDGVPIGTTFNNTANFADPTAPLTFGYAEPGLGYNGAIDEVVLYNRPLTLPEVQGLVPEPGAAGLFLLGLCLLGDFRGRRR